MVYQVQGKLSATDIAAVNDDTRHIIRRAAIRHSLTLAITDTHRGNITIDGTFGFFGNQGTTTFLKNLDNFIQDETIAPLGLQGNLLMVEDGIAHPVNVREGNVFHQHTFETGETREVRLMRV